MTTIDTHVHLLNPQVKFDRAFDKLIVPLFAHQTGVSRNPFRARHLKHLSQQEQVHHKLLFATDFPLPILIRLNLFKMNQVDKQRIAKIKNPFDKYVKLIAHFFGDEHQIFTNYQNLICRG